MYEHDGVLWAPKQCTECQWQRPARARHCDVCGRCVARHDHHCVWINNCVGQGNTVHFLLFLFVNIVVCAYGMRVSMVVQRGCTVGYNMHHITLTPQEP